MKIVRLANFVTATSGGLRTALAELGAGYAAAGHEPFLIVPGSIASVRESDSGLVITLPGRIVPGTGGYHVITARGAVRRVLEQIKPDQIEVSDRSTLRWTGRWARERGVGSVMVSHESLAALLPPLADPLNRATARSYDTVVCTTNWAAAEFRRIGAPNVTHIPLGVDLDRFTPDNFDQAMRDRLARRDEVLLVVCSRLSIEKKPHRAIDALAELRRRGVNAVLAVAGEGPLRARLERRAEGLPVRFLGHLTDRAGLAALLATADVAIAPGPAETFGLAALEALASGTPVVADRRSALGEVVGPAGRCVFGHPGAYADAVEDVLRRDDRRELARLRAERFSWAASVAGFLKVHST
ncbi:glycosyltransferase [Herbidospora sp. RD11066]